MDGRDDRHDDQGTPDVKRPSRVPRAWCFFLPLMASLAKVVELPVFWAEETGGVNTPPREDHDPDGLEVPWL